MRVDGASRVKTLIFPHAQDIDIRAMCLGGDAPAQ